MQPEPPHPDNGRATQYLQSYAGSFDPLENNPNSSPEDGFQHTGRIGFDWLISGTRTLSGTYLYQVDRSQLGVRRIGEFEGQEESQDSEAEFGLTKHKATLLCSQRLGERLALSSYAEWIHKQFDDEDDSASPPRPGRHDSLFLSSTYLTIGRSEGLVFKLRYLFRMNQSSLAAQDYRDYLLIAGPEFRF